MDAPDFLYVRKVQTGTKLFEKLYGYAIHLGSIKLLKKAKQFIH